MEIGLISLVLNLLKCQRKRNRVHQDPSSTDYNHNPSSSGNRDYDRGAPVHHPDCKVSSPKTNNYMP